MADPTDLDRLLHRWADEQRLDAREAAAILHAILPSAPAEAPTAATATLPATWWSDLSTQVSAAIVLATVRPATVASS
jgi:hypothetical protein